MRILLINQYAGSPEIGMEFRPHWMATEWIQAGHEVLVVAGDTTHLRGRIPAGSQAVQGVPFHALRTTPYRGNGPARFLNILSFRAALYAHSRKLVAWAPDVVIASSTHPMDVRPAHRVANDAGVPFVYEVHDLWPLTPMLLGGLSPSHPMIRWMQREEDFGYATCDMAVSLLPGTQEHMVAHGLPENRWVWIPNGVEVPSREVVFPLPPATGQIRLLRQKFPRIVAYAGTVGPANNLDALLAMLPLCKLLGVGVVIVGDGPERERLTERYRLADNLFWVGKVPKSDVIPVLSEADVAYIGLVPSPLFQHGISPNKLFDYMNAGLPIIENIGGANSPVKEAKCGWSIDPRQSSALEHALRSAASLPASELSRMGARGRAFVRSHYLQRALAEKFVGLMEDLAGRGSR